MRIQTQVTDQNASDSKHTNKQNQRHFRNASSSNRISSHSIIQQQSNAISNSNQLQLG